MDCWQRFTRIAAVNRYLKEICMPAFNTEFIQPATKEKTAFVPWIGEQLIDILRKRYERLVVCGKIVLVPKA